MHFEIVRRVVDGLLKISWLPITLASSENPSEEGQLEWGDFPVINYYFCFKIMNLLFQELWQLEDRIDL